MPITIPMHTIARILGRHGLGRTSVEALPGGQINASFLVDEQYVLRVNLRPDEHGKLARERRVLEMLRDLMPVPHTIAYEGSSRLIPHEYMIQTYVPGESLLVRWGNADDGCTASASVAMATLLIRGRARPGRAFMPGVPAMPCDRRVPPAMSSRH
jgi:aminoglycoside phosphotransferase (APT) family kinase protein